MRDVEIKKFFEVQYKLWRDVVYGKDESYEAIVKNTDFLDKVFSELSTDYKFFYKVFDNYTYCKSMVEYFCKGEK